MNRTIITRLLNYLIALVFSSKHTWYYCPCSSSRKWVYYLISPRDTTYFSEEKTEKIAEFKNTRVSGRKDGKPLWEFHAKNGWSTKNRDVTHLFDVTKGKIYKSGKLVVTDLSAPRAKTYRRSELIEVYGDKNNRVKAYIDLGGISNRDKKDWKARRWQQ